MRVGFLIGILALSAIPAAEAAGAASPEPKTHSLFVGADLAVEQRQVFWPVVDVSGTTFVVNAKDRLVKVDVSHGQVNIKVNQELKLADNLVDVQNLSKERAYTPGSDPERKYLRELQAGTAAQMSDYADAAMQRAVYTAGQGPPSGVAPAIPGGAGNGKGGGYVPPIDPVGTASLAASNAYALSYSTLTNPADQAGRMESELSKEQFDAMRVSFVVSSAKTLRNPYVVLIMQYREANEKPGDAHDWIYATELDPIDSSPHKVSILGGGLPPGFVQLSFQLHLYNRGHELATTVAPKRLALTRDEAFEYVLFSYLGENKHATRAAAPVLGRLSTDQRHELSDSEFAVPYFVKVTKDGKPAEAYADPSCTQKITDPKVAALIGQVRFTPALAQGQPVESVAKLSFNDLTL